MTPTLVLKKKIHLNPGDVCNVGHMEVRFPLPQGLSEAFTAVRGQAVITSGEVEAAVFPVSFAKKAKLLQGIFLGEYEPYDRYLNSLGKKFWVFAAPEDLPDSEQDRLVGCNYIDTLKQVASLKDWYGFHGTAYVNDGAVYEALADGSYDGGWIIPTRELLSGKDVNNQHIRLENLYTCQNEGAFVGTYKKMSIDGNEFPRWYWSCTESRLYKAEVWSTRFYDGYEGWAQNKKTERAHCRLVRLVEIKQQRVYI